MQKSILWERGGRAPPLWGVYGGAWLVPIFELYLQYKFESINSHRAWDMANQNLGGEVKPDFDTWFLSRYGIVWQGKNTYAFI